jgi:hypothetical protein
MDENEQLPMTARFKSDCRSGCVAAPLAIQGAWSVPSSAHVGSGSWTTGCVAIILETFVNIPHLPLFVCYPDDSLPRIVENHTHTLEEGFLRKASQEGEYVKHAGGRTLKRSA